MIRRIRALYRRLRAQLARSAPLTRDPSATKTLRLRTRTVDKINYAFMREIEDRHRGRW